MLTEKQDQAIALKAKGLTNKQIAFEMGITESTAREHLVSASKKLGAVNGTNSVYKYAQLQFLTQLAEDSLGQQKLENTAEQLNIEEIAIGLISETNNTISYYRILSAIIEGLKR